MVAKKLQGTAQRLTTHTRPFTISGRYVDDRMEHPESWTGVRPRSTDLTTARAWTIRGAHENRSVKSFAHEQGRRVRGSH